MTVFEVSPLRFLRLALSHWLSYSHCSWTMNSGIFCGQIPFMSPNQRCQSTEVNSRYHTLLHCAIPPPLSRPIDCISCTPKFSENYLHLPGILNDFICCMTLLVIEWLLLQRTAKSEDCQCFWMAWTTTINCPFLMGDLHPIYYVVPWAHPSLRPKRHVDRFSHFCTCTVECPISL